MTKCRNCRQRKEKSSHFPILMIALLAVSFPILESCKKEAVGWQGTMRTENGVVIVENPAEPLYKNASLTLTEELSIGGPDADDESELIMVGGIDVDSKGNIYVLERKLDVIKVFNHEGKFVRKIGMKGKGPGEFEALVCFRILKDREVCAYDLSSHKVVKYTLEGKHVEDRKVVNKTSEMFMPYRIDDAGNTYGIQISASDKLWELVRLTPDLESAHVVANLEKSDTYAKKTYDLLTPFITYDVISGGGLAWGISNEYVIHLEDSSGKAYRRVTKINEPVRVSSEDRAEMEKVYEKTMKELPGYELVIAAQYPHFGELYSDSEKRLIIRLYEKSRDRKSYFLDVFDPEGRYVAKIALPSHMGQLYWKSDRLFAVEKDKEDYPIIKRYAFRWMFQ